VTDVARAGRRGDGEVFGDLIPAEVADDVLYDPGRARVRA
jgi:hypothetical protein